MKKTSYLLPYPEIGNFYIEKVKLGYFTKEETLTLYNKRMQLFRSMKFTNPSELALAEKMFEMGYIAAHIDYPSENGDS